MKTDFFFPYKSHWQKYNTIPLLYFPNKWQQKWSCSTSSCATSCAHWGKTVRILSEQIKAFALLTWGQEALLLPPQLLLVVVHNHSTAEDSFVSFHYLSVHFIRFYSETFQLLYVYVYIYIYIELQHFPETNFPL